MNLTQLRDAVRNRCGFNPSDTFQTDDALNALINEANHSLADEQDWPWLSSTETLTATPGTATLTPGATWQATVALHHVTNDYAGRVEPVSIDDIDRFSTQPGLPAVFAEWDGALVLGPTPDSAYQFRHRFRRFEPDLVADTDTPLSPVTMHRLIVMKAAALAHDRGGDTVKSRVVQLEYENAVARARKRLNRSGAPIIPRVRPGAGW